MATDTLVDVQFEEGRKLINLLAETGFDVTAACWVRTSEPDRWVLYIATDVVDRDGLHAAYLALNPVYRSIPDAWVLFSHVKLIGVDNPITRDILAIRGQLPTRSAIRSRRPYLGDVATEEVYVYPPSETEKGGVRRSFMVRYVRQGTSNTWKATIKPGELYKGMKAKGAVSYTTARREGEAEGDEPFALVSVLLEMDDRLDDPDTFVHPGVSHVLAEQVRTMADEMFGSRHPEAVIEHVGDRTP
jgi:hypothetical protein